MGEQQLYLSSDSLQGLREAGSLGRPVHTLYPQIKAVLEQELGQAFAGLFAEPVVDEQHGRIDWYSRGKGEPVGLSSLPRERRNAIEAQLLSAYEQLQTFVDRYLGSRDVGRVHLGKALQAALVPPAEANVFLVDDNPVVTLWGFFPEGDRTRSKDLAQWRASLQQRTQAELKPVPGVPPEPPASIPPPDPVVSPARHESILARSAVPQQPTGPFRWSWFWGALAGLLLLLLLVIALYGLGKLLRGKDPSTTTTAAAEPTVPVLPDNPNATPGDAPGNPPDRVDDQEFASRLAEADARSGEITVTLLWNNRNDRDLIVRCPSGKRLYYQQPRGCGGHLDVDRNANDELSARPVENIVWPAGSAPAGNYEVLVHHYARKDESVPPQTAFQVRVQRPGETRLYRGEVSPNESKPVTRFTVVR